VAVLAQATRELPDRRGLAGAVDADDEDDAGLPVEAEPARFSEQRRGLLGQGLAQLAELLARFQPADELGRRRHPHVRGDKRLFQTLPGLVVRGVERRRRELLGHRPARFAERVAKASEEPLALLLGLVRRLGVAEKLAPASGHRGRLAPQRLRGDWRGTSAGVRPRHRSETSAPRKGSQSDHVRSQPRTVDAADARHLFHFCCWLATGSDPARGTEPKAPREVTPSGGGFFLLFAR
jgi:hypothetical protein